LFWAKKYTLRHPHRVLPERRICGFGESVSFDGEAVFAEFPALAFSKAVECSMAEISLIENAPVHSEC